VLYAAIMAGVTEADFELPAFKAYGIAYVAASLYYKEHKETPPQLGLCANIQASFANKAQPIPVVVDKLLDLITKAYNVKDEDLIGAHIIKSGMLQTFIDELKLTPLVHKMTTAKPAELSQHVAQLHAATATSRLVSNQDTKLFNEQAYVVMAGARPPVRTGVPIIDIPIGGLREKSLTLVMAESSGGKTMFGTQFVCEQLLAKQPRRVMALYYEQALDGDIAERYYSYMASAPRAVICGKKFHEYPEDVKRRLQGAEVLVNEYLKTYDMSGSLTQGTGGADEVMMFVERNIRAGWVPDMIVIDWLGLMVNRCIVPLGGKNDDARQRYYLTMDKCNVIKERYGVSVVVLHQIAPSVMADKTPAYIPDDKVSQDCKSLSQLTDYTFVYGKRCNKTNCMYHNMAKVRHGARTVRIVRMLPEYNRLEDVSELYEINPGGGRDGEWFQTAGNKVPKI
jgi:hypothetical protein